MSDEQLLVIPTYLAKDKHYELFELCIETLRKTTNAQVLCVDDKSPNEELSEKAQKVTSQYEGIEWSFNDQNKGFAKTVNVGLKQAVENEQDAVLVNQDIEFKQIGWLKQMACNDAEIIGAMLLYPNGLIQHAGIYFSILTRTFDHRFANCLPNTPEALEACYCPVTGALQYIRLEALKNHGYYDESFHLGFEDVDYNLRVIMEGGKALYDPKAKALHHESIIRGGIKRQEQMDSLLYMMKKYQGVDFAGLVPNMLERKI